MARFPLTDQATAFGQDSDIFMTADTLTSNSNVLTAGASATLIPSNVQRNGLQVVVDVAATQPVYLLLRAGTASATNFDIALSAGGSWDGLISGVLWRGAVTFFSSAGAKVAVSEV